MSILVNNINRALSPAYNERQADLSVPQPRNEERIPYHDNDIICENEVERRVSQMNPDERRRYYERLGQQLARLTPI